jgi:small-conductance mechanosensitive channel
LFQVDRAVIEEVIRDGIGGLILAGLFAVIYFATRRFLGKSGKVHTRRERIVTGAGAVVLLLLLLNRRGAETLLSQIAAPLNRLADVARGGWPERTALGIFHTVIATIAVVLIIQAIGRLYWYAEGRIGHWGTNQVGPKLHVMVFLGALLRLFRFFSILLLVVVFLPIVLNFFPRTKSFVDRLEGYLGTPAHDVGMAVIGYLPELAYVAVILILGKYFLRAVKYFFMCIDKGTLVIKNFPTEWAVPTYRLVRTIFLLFLLMVTFPYLPGSKSQFFQGFSLFVGALITFGSTATIGNIVSGTVLTYTRAFKIGDMVTIGERTGVVIEKNLLVTRLLTPKNEEVSIPNGNVLATSVLNYSTRARQGLVLTVSAGIGYDVDWRTVHGLMLEGARATEHILTNPAPRILQSALGDYAVNYELWAYTDAPVEMFYTLAALRGNVLDAFNRAGVEIMTPSILAHRDASGLAIPLEQFPDRGKPGGIAVDIRTDAAVSASV